MNYLVVALGNPGDNYKHTRHNAGWLAVDLAYPELEWSKNSYANARVASYKLEGMSYKLAKPSTFMNLSGETVKYFIDKEDVVPENIIVVYDDIDLPLGKIKISFDRGSGGHNGIKSIEEHVGGRNFVRIRIGISKLIETADAGAVLSKPNVLGNFEESELSALASLAPKIKEAIEKIIKEGKESAMRSYNS